MGDRSIFVLLNDARADGADARLYEAPFEIFNASRADEIDDVLTRADAARTKRGGHLAGFVAYEAGLALEEKLRGLADARTGANGPLVWLGLFEHERVIRADAVDGWLSEHGQGGGSIGPLDPQLSCGGYMTQFDRLQDAIRAGDIYQANLTFPLAGSYRGDPVSLYRALRPAAQAGYGGIVFDGSHWLLSLSPELFVSLQDGAARVRPMKGTRPRGRDGQEDVALKEDLARSTKDKAENLMIVDLMRNDLSRIARPGSVTVDAPFAVETYPTLHQMVTTIHATLSEDRSATDLVRALFPCGSITGAPKIRAMELIDAVERDARGPYCGAIGRIGPDGDAAFNVAIRTLRLTPIENGQGTAVLGVGSAIVADSDAMTEWREAILKAGFVRAATPECAAAQFDLIETMRFEPDSGIALIELHLDRMKESAFALGFSFDRHAARNQIHALCFELEHASKIRLLCARSGAIALEAGDLSPAPTHDMDCIALPLPVDSGDWRLRHKTTDRGFYEAAREVALDNGAHEALFVRDDGRVTEGSRTNVFIEAGGELLTPPSALGLLPGVLRRSLLDDGKAREAEVTLDDLSDGFWIGNGVRGMMPARLRP